jgi:hypothetical protein
MGMVMDTDPEKDTDKETDRHNQGHCKKTGLDIDIRHGLGNGILL